MENKNSAEQILNSIFNIMQELYSEMLLQKNDSDNHLRIFEIFAQLGRTLAGADRASFWRWDKRRHKLITPVATGTSQIVIDDTTGLVGRALAENRTIVTNDPYNHPDFNSSVDKKTGYVTKSILVMPVANCHGEIIGAFQVINKLGDGGFDEKEDVKRLSVAAFICGITLESDLFLADSQHDKLTELKNRLGLQSDYQNFYQKLLQKDSAVSIVMCDVDFFKKVNDTYGHNAGDAVLKHVAQILISNVGENDNAYRWGGEEFITILAGADLSEAVRVAEKMRLDVMNSVCNFQELAIKITMSFGCAEFSSALSMEENIKVADMRLYRAKRTGRNKVISD